MVIDKSICTGIMASFTINKSESHLGGVVKGWHDYVQGGNLYSTRSTQSLLPHVDLVLLLIV